MKRCPKCNRTYASGNQKFCTQDGGLLEVVESAQGDTIRIDSTQFKETVEEAATRAISRELVSESEQFDPFKTVMARPEETTGGHGRNTQDLVPPPSAPLTPAPTSASLPPLPQASGSLPASDSGTLPSLPPLPGSASEPGSSSSDLERTLYTGAPPPQSHPLPPPQSQPLPPIPQSQPLPPQSQPLPQQRQSQPLAAPGGAKRSKLPLVLGLLAVLLFLGAGVIVAGYFVVLPMLAKRGEITTEPTPQPPTEATPRTEPSAAPSSPNQPNEPPPYSPPANGVEFVNSNAKLDGRLAEHYVDFSFYYPRGWQKDPNAGVAGATNFAKVERRIPPDLTQENFAVGLYLSAGSAESDRVAFHTVAENLSSQFAKQFPEYRKVSEGETKAGVYDGYEFRFESISRNTDKGDIKVWGRVIFVPPIDGSKNGVTLLMLATSLAPELERVDDVGVKGELPMLLESFRLGKK